MAIINFDNIVNSVANQQQPAGNGRRRGAGDLPESKVWLNVGVQLGDQFVSLPYGLAIDTMRELSTSGTNEEVVKLHHARNDLLHQMQVAGNRLQPGQEIELKLTVKLRRANEQLQVNRSNNPFAVDLSQFLAAAE